MDQPLIAVTGATGAVGGRVARELARAGARQVLLVRDPSRAPELPGADVHRIAGYAAGDDVRAALEGADTLFLVPLAAAIAALLHLDGHDGRTYDLTGPEAFTFGQAAALMSRMSGKRISFYDESDEEAFASRARYGAPDWEVLGWVSSYWAIREGALENVSPHVRELTGRDPVSLAAFLESSPDALAHVTGPERPEPA